MGISIIGESSSENNFSIAVGSSGNNVIVLGREYSAGAYSVTSQVNDTSLDIYAVNASGSLVGYTNTKGLTCSAGFSTIVVLGATNNDVLTFEYNRTFSPTQAGTVTGAGAYITSATPSDLPNINSTTTIAGGNFATNVGVTFTGTNNVELNAKSIVRVSATELLVTRPDALIQDHSPYDVKVVNPGINTPTAIPFVLSDAVTAGGDPTWVTAAGALTSARVNSAYSVTIQATDPDAGSITYSVVTGFLPAGLSLNSSTGVISGTPTTAQTASFTVAATDSGGNITNRSFSIQVQLLVAATGGTETTSGGYKYHTFTASGTFAVTTGGTVEALVISGGGGGGYLNGGGYGGGGGGAGGYIALTSQSINNAQNYSIVVGAGGAGGNNASGSDGIASSAFGQSPTGGGGGAGVADNLTSIVAGRAGGSGGGGGTADGSGTMGSGGSNVSGQGFPGGSGSNTSSQYRGGGGGGAGAAGQNASSVTLGVGVAGGNGISTYSAWGAATSTGHNISGTRWYAGGGGGGSISSAWAQAITNGAGGNGGGGEGSGITGGSNSQRAGSVGMANTGGGGGGGPYTLNPSYAGGSGIVIIRYPV